jgi:hypothetical protein
MVRVVIATIIIVLFLGFLGFVLFGLGVKTHEKLMRKDGLAGLKGAQMLRDAAIVLGNIGVANTSAHLDDVEVIRPANRQAIDEWLEKYNLERARKP